MTIVTMPITNTLTGSDYTGTIYVGSEQTPAQVILDTGSSTLAINPKTYNPKTDKSLKPTHYGQAVQYGSGEWAGPVIQTTVSLKSGNQFVDTADVYLGVIELGGQFGKPDGILGLAYKALNKAYSFKDPTWPVTDDLLKTLAAYLKNPDQAPREPLPPYLTQLETQGITPNVISFYTLRSVVHVGNGDTTLADVENDPLNQGVLIMGGGEEAEFNKYHEGDFKTVKITSDEWYTVNLQSVTVGDHDPIPMPDSGLSEITIVDSGTNGIYLPHEVMTSVIPQLADYGVPLPPENYKDFKKLPNITFTLEGLSGSVELEMTPETYFQPNSGKCGHTANLLKNTTQGPNILGLPLMNNYFSVFDRAANNGQGVIKFSPIKYPVDTA